MNPRSRPGSPSPSSPNLSRRVFLKIGLSTGGALVIGWGQAGCRPKSPSQSIPSTSDDWIRLEPDGSATLTIPTSELGQGTLTGLGMILAEEADLDWARVRTVPAPSGEIYRVAGYLQRTGASRSVRERYQQLRQIGATIRQSMLEVAAEEWQVPKTECTTREGTVHHAATGRSVAYPALFPRVANRSIGGDPPRLKSAAEFRLIGTTRRRLDVPAMVTGQTTYGIDLEIPGMLHAAVFHSPIPGGEIVGFDESAAMAIPGVTAVVRIPEGIAVVADGWWQASRGVLALAATVNQPTTVWPDTESIERALVAASAQPTRVAVEADPIASRPGDRVVEARYLSAFQSHAPMEPINCTVDLRADRCRIWVGTQQQTRVHRLAERLTGLPADRITVETPAIGGSFGRNLEIDIVAEAIAVAKAVGRPVKVTWSREENFRQDFFRPMALIEFRAIVGDNGFPRSLAVKVVGPSSRRRSNPKLLAKGYDRTLLDGFLTLPYAISSRRVEYVEVELGIKTGYMRGVGFVANVFALESFIDELAAMAGVDPLDYRRRLVGDDQRLVRLLDAAAERCGWVRARAQGRSLGVSLTAKDGTRVVQVVELDGDPRAGGRVTRALTVADPGLVINPGNGVANVEGATLFGLSNALYEGIHFEQGAVVEDNFSRYSILRLAATPEVEAILLPDGSAPSGLAEAGVDTIGPAVANAIARLTGDRCRRLPLTDGRPIPS